MREFIETDDRLPQLQYRLYLGFLIPKFKRTVPLDIQHCKIISFKHGLMLLYQFIEFVTRIHEKEYKFGHLDFQNIFFIENRNESKQRRASQKSHDNKHLLFTVDL